MEQIRSFDVSKAGTRKYWCLQNVRLGYGLPAKYPTAYVDWQNNIQHKNANLPEGVDVPVYWSLTLTLDGKTANYGHVAVSTGGKIWSDGQWFSSVDDLNQRYLGGKGAYLGWGEKVEGINVVKGGKMLVDEEIELEHRIALGRGSTAEERNNWRGKDSLLLTKGLWANKIVQARINKANRYDVVLSQRDTLQSALNDAKATIENLSQRPTKAEYQDMEAKLTGIIADLEKALAEEPTESEVVKSWFSKLIDRITVWIR